MNHWSDCSARQHFGAYGVFIFFVVSGFLICRSFERSRLDDYLRKRMLRIFPGLVACAFLVGAAGAATLSLVEGRVAGIRPAAKHFVALILLADTSDQGLPGLFFSVNRFEKLSTAPSGRWGWNLPAEVASD